MSKAEEHACVAQSLGALRTVAGRAVTGWFGPEYGELTRTPELLAEAGGRYGYEWVNYAHPDLMTVPAGALCALPISYTLDGVNVVCDRRIEVRHRASTVIEAFDRLKQDVDTNGRLHVLNLHLWLTGQASRIPQVDVMLAHIVASDSIWATTGSQIVDWYAGAPGSAPLIAERSL